MNAVSTTASTAASQTLVSHLSTLTSSNPDAGATTTVAGSSTGQKANSGSGFSSPGAIAGYTIGSLVIALIGLIGLYFTWRQYDIAKKNRRDKKAARRNEQLNILQRGSPATGFLI
jgi:hypothetical protein